MENIENKEVDFEHSISKNVYQRVAGVKKLIPYIQKKGEVKFKNGTSYKVVNSEDVLAPANGAINENGLIIVSEILEEKYSEILDNYGNKEFLVILKMLVSWVNIDLPDDRITCNWVAYGKNASPEKAYAFALTFSEKYFILKQLNIATGKDDPDSLGQKDPLPDPTPKKTEIKKETNPDESLKKNVEKYFNLAKDFDSLQNTVAGYLKKYPNLVNSEWFESLHQKRLNELKASEEAIQDLSKAGN